MEDASSEKLHLAEEQHRLATFGNCRFVESLDNAQLAKAGLFLSPGTDFVKCFSCDLELKASDLSSDHMDVLAYHRGKKPKCSFIQKYYSSKSGRCKTFLSVADSLRFEKARLDTFLDWPVLFLSPADLAEDGFYFLKTSDHCACIYCKGIIGAWEETDTPRGEHVKHFPQCTFIKGKPVGNVPMAQSLILAKYNNFSSTKVFNPIEISLGCNSGDEAGLGRRQRDVGNKIHQQVNGLNLQDIGCHEYRGPRYKEYITVDSRVNSFKRWPERVKQHPQELAEAGFYYCGTSDHVRCFHCGNGICNWENDDDPWEEHATWYPKCSFVLLTKGPEYISNIQKGELNDTNGNSEIIAITESELDILMELDIMRAVRDLGIPEAPAKRALRKKLESTGLPFFQFEQCMDSVFLFMEEETRQFLEETYREIDSDDDDENEDQIAPLEASSSQPTVNANRSITIASPSTTSSPPNPTQTSVAPAQDLPPLPTSEFILPLPQLRAHVPLIPLPPREPSDVSGASGTAGETTARCNRGPSSPLQNLPQDRRQTPSLPSPEQSDFGEEKPPERQISSEPSTGGCKGKNSAGIAHKSSDELQEELDKAREIMMCKVCLNAEMTIVFLPCSHMATCASCALNLSTCPVCRGEIKLVIKPIRS